MKNNFNFYRKQKILKNKPQNTQKTAYKQIEKLEKNAKKKQKKKNTTINYTDPEARKSPNKKGKTQTGYNE